VRRGIAPHNALDETVWVRSEPRAPDAEAESCTAGNSGAQIQFPYELGTPGAEARQPESPASPARRAPLRDGGIRVSEPVGYADEVGLPLFSNCTQPSLAPLLSST